MSTNIKCTTGSIFIKNKRICYDIYINHWREVVRFSMKYYKVIFTFEYPNININLHIYKIIYDNSNNYANKIIMYQPIINFENYDNIFNLYYRYIIRIFSINIWKGYEILINNNIQNIKKFNTMSNYKIINYMDL
jgi:hypothetical protein